MENVKVAITWWLNTNMSLNSSSGTQFHNFLKQFDCVSPHKFTEYVINESKVADIRTIRQLSSKKIIFSYATQT